jgi:hypothetical protein
MRAELDRETQPCYVAAMPDTDSCPVFAPVNDLSVALALRQRPLLDGAVPQRLADRGYEFQATIGLSPTFAEASCLSPFDLDGGIFDNVAGSPIRAAARFMETCQFVTLSIAVGSVITPMCHMS